MPDDDEREVVDTTTVPLDEFCQDMSRSDPRVELLAAFRYRELAAGRHHDTASAYKSRLDGTHNSPTAGNSLPQSV